MKINLLGVVFITTLSALALSSCSVDQEAALFSRPAAAGSSEKSKKASVKTGEKSDWATRIEEAKQKREEAKAIADKEKAAKLAAKKKEDALEARKLAAAKSKEEAEKRAEEASRKALADKKLKDKAAADAARKQALADAKEKKERDRADKIAAKRKVELDRDNRQANEVAAVSNRRTGGGFFSRLSLGTPSRYKSEGHHIHVNQGLLSSLNASNAKVEIDISEQRARIYKSTGGYDHLVIETQVSTGKSGYSTSTGTFRIKEKLVAKRSTLYGSWVNSGGSTVSSSGDSRSRPSGGARFIGAEMPYWIRINGGIGMHIGYVPDYPASHGCIRVPPPIQPLIFSKVGVGTSVTIKH
ncbi:L,D-transpeptidase [Verrucomicrobiales bacterium]|jgi:lipoprotein-anchoring transpeptidase ErfK/SrfK|nr:L,D-transpeptidase [Verrucomicrobiales bacterium]MDA7926451.1 L,D-transpeptidase [Verrucomicrobiales bacterium]